MASNLGKNITGGRSKHIQNNNQIRVKNRNVKFKKIMMKMSSFLSFLEGQAW